MLWLFFVLCKQIYSSLLPGGLVCNFSMCLHPHICEHTSNEVIYICSHRHVCIPVSTCTHSGTHCSSCTTPSACWWRCSTLVVVYEVQVSGGGGGMEWVCTWDDNTSAVSLRPQPPSDLSDKLELCEYLLHIQGFCIPHARKQSRAGIRAMPGNPQTHILSLVLENFLYTQIYYAPT